MSQLPPHLSKIHLIGILGIGMSSLAQFLCKLGYQVTGSDRDYNSIHQKIMSDCLKENGIIIFPQDGSGIDEKTQLLIYSSAIEDSNADFVKGHNIVRLHRSYALAQAIKMTGLEQIAIVGSSGKTSVTALIATLLQKLGKDVLMVNGGCVKDFARKDNYGNFKWGKDIVVYEADESDGSLVHYEPDYAVLLNLSKDHFSEDELKKLFITFFTKVKKNVFLSQELLDLYPQAICFDKALSWGYEESNLVFHTANQRYAFHQLGYHSVMNAMAAIKVLNHLGHPENNSMVKALSKFLGVSRRFDYKGQTIKGCDVYDDYAHNVAKIETSIKTMQEKTNKLIVVFQPHGYGPLGFMRQELAKMLQETLAKTTKFYLLPVFYAGGTASFSPTSNDIVIEYQCSGLNIEITSRSKFEKDSKTFEGYTVLVMGARDMSLSLWSEKLVV